MRHIDYYNQFVIAKGGDSSGITPTGTLEIKIQENGTTTHDVTQYAQAEVTVDVPQPEGTIQITQNGQHDVAQYATADVNVPNPSTGTLELDYGDLEFGQTVDETQDVTDKAEVHIAVSAKEPSGTLNITENGTKDVAEYAAVNVQVPQPTGTKEINITQNGDVTEDVKDVATANIHVNVPTTESSGTAELAYTLGKGVYTLDDTTDVSGKAEAHVTVDASALEPTGTAEMAYTMKKGVYTLDETAEVSDKAEAHVIVDASALEPTGTKEINISQNGDTTEDVKDYESVKITANVVDPELKKKYEDLLNVFYGNANVPDIFTNEDVYRIGDYAFYDSTVQEIHVPNAKQIGDNSFEDCEKLSVLDAPNITHIYNYPFTHATMLKECHFPNLISYQKYAFESDPKSTYSVHLEIIDILGGTNPNNYLCFKDCFLLKTLIIRCTDGVCALYSDHSEGCFFESAIPNIYVPDALVEDYKAATNWSTYADQIHALSEYVEPEV